jgi:hypothetical protein
MYKLLRTDIKRNIQLLIMLIIIPSPSQSRNTNSSSMLDQYFYFRTSLVFYTSGMNIIMHTWYWKTSTYESLIPITKRSIVMIVMLADIPSPSQSRNTNSSSMLDQYFYFRTRPFFVLVTLQYHSINTILEYIYIRITYSYNWEML